MSPLWSVKICINYLHTKKHNYRKDLNCGQSSIASPRTDATAGAGWEGGGGGWGGSGSAACYFVYNIIASLSSALCHVVSDPTGQINTIVLVTMVKSCDSLERFGNLLWSRDFILKRSLSGSLFQVEIVYIYNFYNPYLYQFLSVSVS